MSARASLKGKTPITRFHVQMKAGGFANMQPTVSILHREGKGFYFEKAPETYLFVSGKVMETVRNAAKRGEGGHIYPWFTLDREQVTG